MTAHNHEPVILEDLNGCFDGIKVKKLFAYRKDDRTFLLINGHYDSQTHLIFGSDGPTSDLFYYQIVNRIREAVITTDPKGKIVYFNPIAAAMFDYRFDQLIGLNDTHLLSEPLSSQRENITTRSVYGIKQSGERFLIEMTVLTQADGLLTGIISRVPPKKDDEQLSTKKTFISSMSHEILTPLNGIIGMVQLIKQENLPKSMKESVEIIHECGVQLVKIVNNILDYSKTATGRIKFEKEHFNLKECLGQCVDSFSCQSDDGELAFHFRYDKHLSDFIYGDRKRIKQVVYNLLNNAVKFTNSGNITLEAEPRDRQIVIRVKDTGEGIPAEFQERIFEPFNQITDNYTRESGQSAGLGLPISRNLARLMKGDLTVASQPGMGAAFEFSFQADQIKSPTVSLDLSPEQLERLKELKILAVDDQVNNRIILKGMLAPYCDQLVIARSSKEVLELVKKHPFDVILVDVVMPGINGIELFDHIQENCQGKIIALSSISDLIEFSNKFDYVMIKPLNQEHLLKVILHCISNDVLAKPPCDELEAHGSQTVPKKDCSEKILIVEDNPNNCTVIKLLLHKLGYRDISTAHDGVKAVKMALENDYHFILMDLKLPGIDGITASRQIIKVKPASKIVIVSACLLDEDIKQYRDCGIYHYLSKPIVVSELQQLLEDL
jgi:PAS domain S-box-containing protein